MEPNTNVIPTYYVNSADFDDTKVGELLKFQGWVNFLKKDFVTWPSFVAQFYKFAEVEISEHQALQFRVFINLGDGRALSYDQDNFINDFGLLGDICAITPQIPFYDYAIQQWPVDLIAKGIGNLDDALATLNNLSLRPITHPRASGGAVLDSLTGDDKLLLKIVTNCLLPATNTHLSVNKLHVLLLCMIKEKVKINLPVLMLKHMLKTMTNKKYDSIPYGGLVTHILRYWGFQGDNMSRQTAIAINAQTYIGQGSVLCNGRLLQAWEVQQLTSKDKAVEDQESSNTEGTSPFKAALSTGDKFQQIYRRQGRLMEMVKLIGAAVGCSSSAMEELGYLSTEE